MSLSLSALVLAWGMVLPGVQHAHVGGGDSTHRHETCHETAHHGPHDHDSEGGHRDHADHATAPGASVPADFVVHLHWQLLGLEFSMPVPDVPADENSDERTAPSMVVRTINGIVPATQAGPSFDRVLLAGICTPGTDVVRNSEPVPRSLNLVTSIPLCDSARLERTGVRLA